MRVACSCSDFAGGRDHKVQVLVFTLAHFGMGISEHGRGAKRVPHSNKVRYSNVCKQGGHESSEAHPRQGRTGLTDSNQEMTESMPG